ncbi:MAG: hypothetical protein DRN81_06935 [Thermoproteota archaeon]|nr:MAG: hypothetical protein DRN81_06935 [Candidatus Korarchaeota archaeon]
MFDHCAEGPVTIAAHAGTDARGELYLSVYALVPSREASRVRLVMSDAEGDARAIVVDLHPEHKALEYVVLHYFSAQEQPWRTIQAMIPRNSAYRIDARSSAKVPLPYERDEVTCVVAIEDRCGRLGNFVPVVEYNAAP